jgi:hypothetical protein
VAMRDTPRHHFVLRASKALANCDWNGTDYHLLYNTSEEIYRYLDQRSVSVIVVEDSPILKAFPHQALLTRMLNDHTNEWAPVAMVKTSATSSSAVKVFRRTRMHEL